jgi:hypothetical protein
MTLPYFKNVRKDLVDKVFEDKGSHDRRMGNTKAFDEDIVDGIEVDEILFFLGYDFVDDPLAGKSVINLKEEKRHVRLP